MFKDSQEKNAKPISPEVRYRDTVLRVADGLILGAAQARGLQLVEEQSELHPEPTFTQSGPSVGPEWRTTDVSSVYPEVTTPVAPPVRWEAPTVDPQEVPVYPQSPELYQRITTTPVAEEAPVAIEPVPIVTPEGQPNIMQLLENVQHAHDEAEAA